MGWGGCWKTSLGNTQTSDLVHTSSYCMGGMIFSRGVPFCKNIITNVGYSLDIVQYIKRES